MHPDSAEAATVRTYLEWMVEIRGPSYERQARYKGCGKSAEQGHYDLEKVKERILEYLSVRKLKKR